MFSPYRQYFSRIKAAFVEISLFWVGKKSQIYTASLATDNTLKGLFKMERILCLCPLQQLNFQMAGQKRSWYRDYKRPPPPRLHLQNKRSGGPYRPPDKHFLPINKHKETMAIESHLLKIIHSPLGFILHLDK